ncbi:MAG: TetR/AcrR family transcriptional regulator [Spirochaetes bacterium]|uniref:TetR/AcrR family transcriptional regulator n=1 Tax=Candidatus Ornithospirochaeta stercoripullorum TaxID=2840899 RepID=A0A9D9E4G4_9SPIO|nr:TetR/AcrR family transcriptional regulator [Candidatus Ornithospirochaeta stercoripullorum]
MPRTPANVVEKRPAEIIDGCKRLYKEKSFREITLKDISVETSLSRPSIYNYFQTKEEIFLAILEDEYSKWCKTLERSFSVNSMTVCEFAEAIAASLRPRELLLKILCMNLYDIEENSREECLIAFKRQYKVSLDLIEAALAEFFPSLTEKEKKSFIFQFYPFMYGIYPYVHPTEKQKKAMKEAGMESYKTSVYDLSRSFVSSLLSGILRSHNK